MLIPNKVRAEGGREIDKFRGLSDPQDTQSGAEAWVGSITRANGVTPENPNLGCSQVQLPDGSIHYLFEVIESAPEAILGKTHISRFGNTLSMLVKLLDAKKKFLLQCHPTREVAKRIWNSQYGKTECWYILSVRDDVDEPPYIYYGFKPGITKAIFEKAYEHSNLENMEPVERLCHKITVHPGETYFIPGGMPHALGAGCFVIEIQEPSDLTAVPIPQKDLIAFRKNANPKGQFIPIDDELYRERMIESFDFEGLTQDEALKTGLVTKTVEKSGLWGEKKILIGNQQTEYFGCSEWTIHGEVELDDAHSIQIGIVTAGSGKLKWQDGYIEVKQGSEIFFPCQAKGIIAEGNMNIVLCKCQQGRIEED